MHHAKRRPLALPDPVLLDIYCSMKLQSENIPAGPSPILPWLVAIAFFMQMLDGTILNVALPGISRDLGVSALRMQSVVIAYMLTTALFIPASGWLADHFGTRKVFFAAISLFTLGSLLCAMSTSLAFLVASRIVQGFGGALLVPVGRLTILRAYPRVDLVKVLSFVTLPGMVGPLLGPVVGGFLVEYASWHWIFLINLPVGAVGILLTLRYLPDFKEPEAKVFDFRGFLFFGASMVLISVAMEGFGELHLPKVQSTVLCILGMLCMCVYWLRCAVRPHALFSAHLFRTRSFTVGILGNLFARLGVGAIPFLMPLFLQLVIGFSPFMAGVYMIPQALAALTAKRFITPLVKRHGFRRLLGVNTVLQGGIIASFALIGPDTPRYALVLLLLLLGACNSLQFTAMNSLALIDLPQCDAGSGNSLLSVAMQLSASTAVALAAALLDGFGGGAAGARGAEALFPVFHYTFLTLGAVGACSAAIFWQTPPDAGKGGPREACDTEEGDPLPHHPGE